MPFVPANNVFECVAKGNANGQAWNNVWHVRHGGNQAVPSPQAVAEWFGTRWHDAFMPSISGHAQLEKITVRALDEQFSVQAEKVYAPPINGHVTGDSFPANVALLVQKLTGKIGRMHRGRSYLPAVPENFSTASNGLIAAATQTAIQARLNTFRQALLADISATSMAPVLVSRFVGGVARPQAVVTEISALTLSPYLATQRERLKRGS